MRSTTQIRAFLKVTPQLVSAALYAHVMALFERTEWGISRKGKGKIKSQTACMLTNHRYANMDFILFHSLIGAKNDHLMFLYDIACQWSRNLSQRLVQLPNSMQLSDKQLHLLQFAIPKFHISAHGLDCQCDFSFNYRPYMARTDGEDPERWWAHINPVSMSTKEMGPGARLDTLDDHAGAWNWQKITGFGTYFKLNLVSY
jgi:hypothetical protein